VGMKERVPSSGLEDPLKAHNLSIYHWIFIALNGRVLVLTVRTNAPPYSTRPYCATAVKRMIPTNIGFLIRPRNTFNSLPMFLREREREREGVRERERRREGMGEEGWEGDVDGKGEGGGVGRMR
jgi:hypothetical protein